MKIDIIQRVANFYDLLASEIIQIPDPQTSSVITTDYKSIRNVANTGNTRLVSFQLIKQRQIIAEWIDLVYRQIIASNK